jgi:tRNA(fMet)-specific endonuclease VapC
LEKKGKLMGALDLMIAAHAQSLNLILVTNNVKKFSRVDDLKIESWVHPL